MESSSTPYSFELCISCGNIPKKFPVPQLGSSIFACSTPIFFNALYIAFITIGGV